MHARLAKAVVLALALGLSLGGCLRQRLSVSIPMGVDNPFWARRFDEAGIRGTFVLYDPVAERWQFHNKARADSAFSPASTFKVFNSLVGLTEKAVAHDSVVLPWDGVKRGWEKWNMDHSMRTAFQYSAVWFYQEIARRVGPKRMQFWLDKAGYGNRQMGGGIDQFWLTGDLRITAIEQIEFLFSLEALDLPFPRDVQENVHRIMLADSGPDWKLYAKTGWSAAEGMPQVGWYVGFVHRGDERRIFAMNIDIVRDGDAAQRQALTWAILAGEGLIEEP